MKRLLFYACFSLLLFSCARETMDSFSQMDCFSVCAQESNRVSLSDVQAFAMNNDLRTKTGEVVDYTIRPYLGKNADTLFFIINYRDNNGWKIISSDKRTPPIIAESSRGRFSLEGVNTGFFIWMDAIVGDMSIIKQLPDDGLSFSQEEINEHKAFWSGEPMRPHEPIAEEPDGHWEVRVQTETEVYDSLPHIAPKWDQWSPYNVFCPLQTNGIGRAPAGCVALAGAQTLYVIHENTGYPQLMCNNAVCYGNIYNHYTEYYGWSSSSWSEMSKDYKYSSETADAEAAMIAFVGGLLQIEYSDSVTNSYTYHLKSRLFNNIGINCSYGFYNEAIVKSSLLSNYPVIVGAETAIIPNGDGHCFVIDGYKRTRVKTTRTQIWVPDDPDHFTDPNHLYDDIVTITYSNPEITYIQINWGWSSQWISSTNDGWYSLTGSWHVEIDNEDEYYDYYREMIYNFTVSGI